MKFIKLQPITGIYLMQAIKAMAGTLIGIYVPVYLLKLGYPLGDVFLLWLIYGISIFVFSAIVAFSPKNIGLKQIITVSVLLDFAYLFLLYRISTDHLPVIFIAVLSGLQQAFYWFPLNVFFSKHSNERKLGFSVGGMIAIPKLLTMPIPIIAGLIILRFGFNALFIFSGILYLLSLIPLLAIPEINETVKPDIRIYLRLFKQNTKYFFAEFLENIREEMEYIVVPVFIFITFTNLLSVGIVGTATQLGGILFALIIGKISDTSNKKVLMRIGAFTMIVAWIARIIFQMPIVFYAASLIVGFVEILVLIPFTSIIYKNAKENNPIEFLLFREAAVGLARAFVYSIVILLVTQLAKTFFMPVISLTLFSFY